jgi:acyl carrier protein
MAPTQHHSVASSARFIEDLGYDSLHLMSLINEIFDTLELELPEADDIEQFEGLEAVAQLEDLVIRKLMTARSPAGADHVR